MERRRSLPVRAEPLACRNGEELSSRFRIVTICTHYDEKLDLVYFQSTSLSSE
jgi:hypothetical protein